ncbi:TetR/AcrR family transcriptional regulator [Pantoea agglomerans]|nr:TetR/AcrR family transcriptional regulator [Pantoea agglomerans]
MRRGVSKPVVYDHFTTRHGLLAALYDDFDRRQTEKMEAAMNAAPMVMQQKAEVLAACYVDCVMTEGREIPELLSALSTSPELAAVKRHYQLDFIARCQRWFVPLAGSSGIPEAGMWGLLGGRGCHRRCGGTRRCQQTGRRAGDHCHGRGAGGRQPCVGIGLA